MWPVLWLALPSTPVSVSVSGGHARVQDFRTLLVGGLVPRSLAGPAEVAACMTHVAQHYSKVALAHWPAAGVFHITTVCPAVHCTVCSFKRASS
jgi:hypothetical protein